MVSEYDQEIPQSQTAGNPVTPRGRADQPSRDTRKTYKAKQPALALPHQDKSTYNKNRAITDSHNGSKNKQKANNNRTTALERTAA